MPQWAESRAHTKKKGRVCSFGGETLHSSVAMAYHSWQDGHTAAVLKSLAARAGQTLLVFLGGFFVGGGFFSPWAWSSLKTSAQYKGLPSKPARLNSNPVQRIEMWEGAILQHNQHHGIGNASKHTGKETPQLSLSAGSMWVSKLFLSTIYHSQAENIGEKK